MNSKQENNDKVYVSDNKMLYRYPKDDYYADSVSLENGKICMWRYMKMVSLYLIRL